MIETPGVWQCSELQIFGRGCQDRGGIVAMLIQVSGRPIPSIGTAAGSVWIGRSDGIFVSEASADLKLKSGSSSDAEATPLGE